MNNYAIIAAKSNSQRLKKKNFIKIDGKSLLNHVYENCLKSKIFQNIIISSDKILNFNNKEFQFHLRSKDLTLSKVSVFEVSKKIIKEYKLKNNDNIFIIYPTAILIKKKVITKSKNIFLKSEYDCLMGASKMASSPFKALYKTKNNYFKPLMNKQILKQTDKNFFFCNGSFFWIKVKHIKKYNNFYTPKLGIYELQTNESCDVDDVNDLKILKKKYFKQL